MAGTTCGAGFSSTEIEDFFEVGWVLRKGLFDADEVERMRACFDGLERTASRLTETGLYDGAHFVLGSKDGAQVIERVVWAGGCQPYLLQIGSDPRLVAPAAELLQSGVIDQLLCQAHFKRPRDGVCFSWHQDIQHRDKGDGTWSDVNGRGSFVQTLIALDDMAPDSGPLLFVPGSSKWGRLDFDAPRDEEPPGSRERLISLCSERAVTIAARPGDTLFFGPYAAHASFENTSSRYRRVLINGYASPGANRRCYPGAGIGRRLSASTGTSS